MANGEYLELNILCVYVNSYYFLGISMPHYSRATETPHIAIAMRWTKFMGKYILNHWVLQDIIYFCVVLETTNCSLDNFLSRYLCMQRVKKVNWDNKNNKRHIGGSSLFMHVITKNINGKNIMMNSISSNTFLNVISWDTSYSTIWSVWGNVDFLM